MENNIQQKEENGAGMFFIEQDGKLVAELTYTVEDNGIITLDHTEVQPEMEGKGLASKLVKHSVEYARKNHKKLDPLCSYAEKQFQKHKDYQDVRS